LRERPREASREMILEASDWALMDHCGEIKTPWKLNSQNSELGSFRWGRSTQRNTLTPMNG